MGKEKKKKFEWFDIKWAMFFCAFLMGAIFQMFLSVFDSGFGHLLVWIIIIPILFGMYMLFRSAMEIKEDKRG